MLFEGGFTFLNFMVDVFVIFLFVMWFWLLITVFGDLFRRADTSGFAKVLWVIFLIALPFLGVFLYLLTQGSGMARRSEAQMQEAREQIRAAVGFSAADEIAKLERLKSAGTISPAEYSSLRAQLVTPQRH
jgi:hypothetical protein